MQVRRRCNASLCLSDLTFVDESYTRRALADLESLRSAGLLDPQDYDERLQALGAVLPRRDARRARLSARPLWWFLTVESACKASIVAYALLVA